MYILILMTTRPTTDLWEEKLVLATGHSSRRDGSRGVGNQREALPGPYVSWPGLEAIYTGSCDISFYLLGVSLEWSTNKPKQKQKQKRAVASTNPGRWPKHHRLLHSDSSNLWNHSDRFLLSCCSQRWSLGLKAQEVASVFKTAR